MIVWENAWYEPHQSARMLHVYLPDWYYDTAERFPVMYFFDGHNLFFDENATYGRSWRLTGFLDNWEKPMIVVGVECSHVEGERESEYMPYEHGPNSKWGTESLGQQTLLWLEGVVKPFIDGRFRTWPHREATGIAGAELGGLMALYGVICHNKTFGKAAALSSGTRFFERDLTMSLLTNEISPDTRVYLSWGEHDAGRHYRSGRYFDPRFDSAEALSTWAIAEELELRGAITHVHYRRTKWRYEADWDKQVPRLMDFLWLNRER